VVLVSDTLGHLILDNIQVELVLMELGKMWRVEMVLDILDQLNLGSKLVLG